jgi:CspA family cold shock protein
MGQGEARKESGLKETEPRIQSAPLSLIHTQLKIGTANQRHPFSPERLFSAIQLRK